MRTSGSVRCIAGEPARIGHGSTDARYGACMATYAIGDVQGCYDSLEALLGKVGFDREQDQLWFCGDLVNRGPSSVEVLRFIRGLGDRAVAVLGNHDLHLIAAHFGLRRVRSRDTLRDVLRAEDRRALVDWLLHRPLVHRGERYFVVHAGLAPSWRLGDAERIARETEAQLRNDPHRVLETFISASNFRYRETLSRSRRAAAALATFTLLRACEPDGTLLTDYSGPPESIPTGFGAWYDLRAAERLQLGRRMPPRTCIVFGHWAAQGLLVRDDVIGLDTGCVWGGRLSALRLDDGKLFSVAARD